MGLFDAFRKFKGQGDYQGEQPVRLSSTPWGQESWKNLQQGFARKGTGYTPELIDSSKATWANSARDFLTNVATPQITSQASARGMGRSSLVPAQIGRAGVEQSLGLAEKLAALQQAGQNQEIATQRSAMGIMPGVAQADVASQMARANFQKANFDQQLGYRQAAEQAKRESMDKLISMGGMAALGAGAGGLGALSGLGIEAGGMGALQGGIAGMSGDFGMFKPDTPLFGTPAEAVDIGGENDVKSTLAQKYGITPEQLEAILRGE